MTLTRAVYLTKIKYNLSFSYHRMIAEWLGCYEYVIPEKRKLHEPLVDLIIKYSMKNYIEIPYESRPLFAYHHTMNLSVNLLIHEQIFLEKELAKLYYE